MFAEKLKSNRKKLGYSQEMLAEKAGINIRTVQRLEKGETEPHGDTVVRVADALQVKPGDLLDYQKKEDNTYLMFLNLSALSFLMFPLLGIILPLILWITKKDQINHVDSFGKRIINYQITWNVVLFAGLIIFHTLWQPYVLSSMTEISPSIIRSNLYIPYYITFGSLYVYNLVITVVNAIMAKSTADTWYYPRINFVR